MQWVRKGQVSSIDSENMTLRVVFSGVDASVSPDMDIIVPPSGNQVYQIPEIGDTVICVFTGEQGFCIGLLQDTTPDELEEGDWGVYFDDENKIVYKDGKLVLKAPEVLLEGNLKVSGTILSGSS
ncbi:hypothetical protein [Paenibacillus alvei]|uniref:hypothetical protein n=1 Tax=Paenibacillus alvei TaxID=44250 RepID=UPI0013D9C44B|nr:hypothetical protein [Paenibacillus alvei]NEZ43725.1 hypothetical protein [Paenibacillus alvei]